MRAVPRIRAQTSIGRDAWLEKIIGVPLRPRRLGDGGVGLPVGELEHADRREQYRAGQPPAEQLDAGVARETSRSIRGTISQRSNACRLASRVRSFPAPAAIYANASLVILARASASSRPASMGTRGVRPLTPPT